MKKFGFLFIFLFFVTLTAISDEIIMTEENKSNDINLEISQPQKTYNLSGSKYSKTSDYNKNFENKSVHDFSQQNSNSKKSVKTGKNKKFKDISVGAESTHTTSGETYNNSNTVYTEYEKKKFKLNTSYTKKTELNQENQDKGTLSVTPEYKINDHVSVQNKYSTNMNDSSTKGEVKLNVKPFKDDRMDLGVGAGQKYSQTAPASSQVNFSTNIRW